MGRACSMNWGEKEFMYVISGITERKETVRKKKT
jgi:hypothetical protein